MRIETDYLIVGSGLAGLFFALKAADRGTVALLTKRGVQESNTSCAQGGIATVTDSQDSFALHIQDTLEAGAGLCHPEVVEVGVREGPEVVEELWSIGTRFTQEESGRLSLEREGGHSRPRIVHADDFTGQEVARSLLAAVQARDRVRIYEHHMALELIVDQAPRCWGVRALDLGGGEPVEFTAPVVLLATGGTGQVYCHTTNPEVASGDGIAMAYRAGATVGNLEFMQFHPTVLYLPGGRPFLITEALRGYGGVLVNHRSEAFVDAYHRMGSLATRDVVTRAIVDELKKSGRECVFIDVRGKDAQETRRRFPNIYRHCLGLGIDITAVPIPVVPAAHYMCGGVRTDVDGATDIPGLYAAGEVALTGLHGANRLASNSLLEAMVFARRAFRHALEHGSGQRVPAVLPAGAQGGTGDRGGAGELARQRERIGRCCWDDVGIVRTDQGLGRVCGQLEALEEEIEALYQQRDPDAGVAELRNLASVAVLMAHAARMRQESRGVHFNSDHPERDDDNWRHDTLMQAAR